MKLVLPYVDISEVFYDDANEMHLIVKDKYGKWKLINDELKVYIDDNDNIGIKLDDNYNYNNLKEELNEFKIYCYNYNNESWIIYRRLGCKKQICF